MRQTLVEVLGAERGTDLYSMTWLRDRVLFHLDPAQSHGQIFVAEIQSSIVGHFIVRIELDEQGLHFGYGSTIFVDPVHRRQRIAAALLTAGEDWMRERGVSESLYFTAETNEKLINLFCKHGYKQIERSDEMVKLKKTFN